MAKELLISLSICCYTVIAIPKSLYLRLALNSQSSFLSICLNHGWMQPQSAFCTLFSKFHVQINSFIYLFYLVTKVMEHPTLEQCHIVPEAEKENTTIPCGISTLDTWIKQIIWKNVTSNQPKLTTHMEGQISEQYNWPAQACSTSLLNTSMYNNFLKF